MDWTTWGLALIAVVQVLGLAYIATLRRKVNDVANNASPKPKTVYTTPRPQETGTRSTILAARPGAREFDITDIDPGELANLVSVVVRNGDCVCFSLTSDRGALSIVVLQGITRHKCYAKDGEQLLVVSHDLLEQLY